MKMKKRFLGILLTLALVLGLMPGMSLTAYAAPTCPNPGCRSTNVEPFGNSANEWECLDCGYIFGASSGGDESDDNNYAQYKNTTTVIKFDDKDWYLIDYDDDTVTLLAKKCVGASKFDSNGSSNTYSGSTVESFVNNWYSDNITSDAKAAVNGSGMFLLTTDQANELSSDVLKCSQASGAEMNFWWLCSPGTNDEDCAVMGVYGEDGEDVTDCSVLWVFGVRPALKLDLSKVTFDSTSKTFSLKSSHTGVTWDADQTIETTQEISGGVTVVSDITVTVSSGVVLTVNGGINANGKTVTVKGPGTLIIHGATGSNGAAGYSGTDGEAGGDGFTGNIIVDGATVTVTGGTGGKGGSDGTGGFYGGSGGNGVEGNVTVISGSIEVTGGTGGNGGDGEDEGGSGGNGGIGVNGTVTVTGGSATLAGGTGGNVGYGYAAGENGGKGKAVSGTITGSGVESEDNSNWSVVSGGTSNKQYVVIGGTALHTHGDLTFTAWESTNSLPTEAGNYYLTGDVKLDNTWFAPNGTTNLCLDGHSIGCAEGMPIQPICVEGEGTTLKLYDKDDNSGTITGALSTAGGVDVRNGGTFHMYGGTVTGNTSTDHGGGVRVRNNATFYLYGGTIENNKTQNMGGYGGGVHVETDSSFYMSGGSIQNNTAFAAAGVYIGMNCAFYMSGGSITGNVAEMGADGGVAFTGDSSAKLVLSGDVTISDNLFKIDDDEADFHISQPSNLTLVSGMKIEVAGALTGEGKICIAPQQARGVFTNSTGTAKAADYIDKFATDSRMYRIKTEGDELRIDAPHLVIGGTFVYDDNAADVFGDGTVKFTPASDESSNAKLTLNGYQYDGTDVSEREGIVYFDNIPLDIVLKGENKIKVVNAPGIMINVPANTVISSDNGGSLEVVSEQGDAIYANGALTVESGTISATGANRGIAANGINFNGGKIVATGTGERGYGIYCESLPWLSASSVSINSGISSLIASGTLGAVYGNATNALEGFGWSNAEGTEGREAIAVTAEARSLDYKKVAFVSHTHGFTYSASGATITATCANADGGCTLTDNKATLTIAAPDNLTYDKSAKAAVITDANGIQGTAKVQYQTKSGSTYGEATETAPTNAGTYKASITVGGATANVEYTIAKADPTYTAPTGVTATYGDTLADIALPTGWTWADNTANVGNAGTNTIKANFTPADTANYNTVNNIDVTVTVAKASQTAPAAPTEAGKTINSITLNEIPNGEYKCGAGDWQTSPTFTGLAQNTSYTFRQRYAADENHNASVGSDETVIRTNNHSHEWSFSATGATITATCTGTGTCSLTNNQISVTLVAPEGNPDLVYNGSDHVATLDGAEAFNAATGMNVSAADIVYNYKATSSESADVVTETKNAGIYQALYTLRTPNSPRPFVGIQFTVGKADPVATAPTASATYGQTLADVTLTNPTGNTAGTWAFVDDATTSVGSVGSHTFKANFTPDDATNYNTAENVNVTVTVGKATPTYTVPTGLTATYGDTLSSVALPTGWAWTNGAQSVGNVGSNTFTATFTPTDTDNYNTVENVNVTVTVGKATPTYTVPTGLTATYGDTLSSVALPTGWAWTNGAQSVGDAGSNTFTANFTPDDATNYNTAENVNVTVTVAPASVTLTANSGTETYDTIEKTVEGFTCSVDGLTFDGVAATVSATNAGIYDVTFSGVALNETKDTTGNYVVTATTDGKLTIGKAPLTIKALDQTMYVNGKLPDLGNPEQNAHYTVSGLIGEDTLSVTPTLTYQKDNEAAEPETDKTGTYDIVPSGAAADNYEIAYESGTLIIKHHSSSGSTSITVPVSGDNETVNVKIEVKNNSATVKEADVDKVLEAEKVGTVTIDASIVQKNVNEVLIPGAMVDKIADAVADKKNDADSMEVKLPSGSVTFDADAVAAISEKTDGKDLTLHLDDIRVTALNSAQQNATKELEVEVVLDAYLTSGGQRISDFKGGSATVKVPYTLKSGQTAAGLVVWYVANDGSKTQMPARYVNNEIVFTVPHFSNYVIAYDAERAKECPKDAICPISAFTDAQPTAWYHDGVHFCLENGMMNGIGNGKFNPNGTTSRAMIVTILYRLENSPKVTAENPFTDVTDGKWYTDAVIWASENKIVEGYGDGTFKPDGDITREQLAAIIYRYAQSKGQGFTGSWMFLLDYPDASAISSWADEAMHWCVMNGIINGKDGKLVPGGNASRAEAATMLWRFCTKTEK